MQFCNYELFICADLCYIAGWFCSNMATAASSWLVSWIAFVIISAAVVSVFHITKCRDAHRHKLHISLCLTCLFFVLYVVFPVAACITNLLEDTRTTWSCSSRTVLTCCAYSCTPEGALLRFTLIQPPNATVTVRRWLNAPCDVATLCIMKM